MGKQKKPRTFSWRTLIDIPYALVLVGLPILVLTHRVGGFIALILVAVWAVLNYLYFRFRMKFDRGMMKLVSFIILVVALGMMCILFGSDAWDWLAARIGWFPTALVFLVVIAVLAIAVWIIG